MSLIAGVGADDFWLELIGRLRPGVSAAEEHHATHVSRLQSEQVPQLPAAALVRHDPQEVVDLGRCEELRLVDQHDDAPVAHGAREDGGDPVEQLVDTLRRLPPANGEGMGGRLRSAVVVGVLVGLGAAGATAQVIEEPRALFSAAVLLEKVLQRLQRGAGLQKELSQAAAPPVAVSSTSSERPPTHSLGAWSAVGLDGRSRIETKSSSSVTFGVCR